MSRRSSRGRSASAGTSDGGYSLIESTIGWLAFFGVVMLVVQLALVWHGRHVAEAAARDGLEAARVYQGTTSTGRAAATGYLRDVAPSLLQDPQVNITRSLTTVRVEVRASVLRVIPGWNFTVHASASGPVERFVSESPQMPPDARIVRGALNGVTWL